MSEFLPDRCRPQTVDEAASTRAATSRGRATAHRRRVAGRATLGYSPSP